MENDLSDNQRRLICRVLFLLVCALPTIAVVYFASHQRTADQWSQLIQAELGVETSIGGVETPRPGEFVFRDVKLYDEQGEPVFESLKANVSVGNTNRIDFRNRIVMTRAGLSHFLNEASGRLVKPRNDLKPWSVVFHDLEVIDETAPEFSSHPFHSNHVHVELGNGINGACVTLEAKEWGKFELVRDPGNGEFQVAIDSMTSGTIPCWLAKDWFPELTELLGSDALFSGFAGINSLGGFTNCAVTGQFRDVELSRVRGLEPGVANAANIIQVESWQLEESDWIKGRAWVLLGDRRFEIPDPEIDIPISPPTEQFHRAIRYAFQDVVDGKVQR